MVNHLIYADYLVIISPSAKRRVRLLAICSVYGENHVILFNPDTTVCVCVYVS